MRNSCTQEIKLDIWRTFLGNYYSQTHHSIIYQYTAARCIFNSPLSVWKYSQIQSFTFEILSQRNKKSK